MIIKFFYFASVFILFSCTDIDDQPIPKVFDKNLDELILTKRITPIDNRHKAFTDLVYFDNKWFLTYRESDKHIFGTDGIVYIVSSTNADDWSLVKKYQYKDFDLRDPKFSVNNGKLMFYVHATKYLDKNSSIPDEFKDFRSDYIPETGWGELSNVVLSNEEKKFDKVKGNEAYPWRITWHKNKAYAFGYNFHYDFFNFYTSDDGINFKNTNSVKAIYGSPNEATIRVDVKGVFYTVVRREYAIALIGRSSNLGLTWNWIYNIPIYAFGGPNFLFYKDGIIISGREKEKLILGYYNFEKNEYKKVFTFDSGGDCSYPGMYIKDNFLWISYYSQHEQKKGTSIYLSKINLNKLEL